MQDTLTTCVGANIKEKTDTETDVLEFSSCENVAGEADFDHNNASCSNQPNYACNSLDQASRSDLYHDLKISEKKTLIFSSHGDLIGSAPYDEISNERPVILRKSFLSRGLQIVF